MAKGKKAGGGSGQHKNHGPKTRRFHHYDKMGRLTMAESKMLIKYTDREAFDQAIAARGAKGDFNLLWKDFTENWCSSKEKQDEYFAQIRKPAKK